ncbi:hypothetical protein [Iamia sp.]|uniref:hypothetical protein n=1 Tax=Iamia sp. TaxID=2722710 RepID=UPI002BE9EFF3|nr:hypothetical protein [Iamia sp.]HXH56701.1 hypothetical protein [Iamia sp.]
MGITVLDVAAPPRLPTPATAQFGVGVTGYSFGPDVHVIDRLGLDDPLTARFRIDRPGFIGHEKPIPKAWLAARVATGPVDPEVFGGDGLATPLHESRGDRFDEDVAIAREVLDCEPLRELRNATTEPFTPGRALSNLWRAPGLTRLVVPPAPADARDELC